MDQAKSKVSITLSPEVIRTVDAAARKQGATRSSVIEAWLRRAAHQEAEATLRAETIAYYQGLDAAARDEERAMAGASARAARRVRIDD